MKTCLHAFLALHLGLAAVMAQPVITNQPVSQTNIAGATVTFFVGATGAPPLSYQWVFNTLANRLPGATNDTLIMPNVQASNAGNYRVTITNAAGSVLSTSARLTVLAPPIIARQPASQLAEVGDPVAISVTATGTPPLSYQWRFEGQTLVGQTRSNVTWTSVQLSNAGAYSVIITNIAGSITSQVAALTFVPSVFSKITTGSLVNDGGYSFGCAWGDYNNDGWVDLFVANDYLVNGSRVEDNNASDFLYRNNGDGTFTRVTNVVAAQDTFWSISGAWGDYDNDGHLDLFVGNPGHPNALFRNRGDGSFTKVTTGVIATESQTSHAAVWGDFDRDGWIDMFIANFWDDPPPTLPNVLYRNLGDGSFSKVSFGPKPANSIYSWNVAWGDFNNDGWPDLFVPQGGTRTPERSQNSLLYRNGQNGGFVLLTNSVVFTNRANGVACAWGDYDNDGFLDLFVSNFYGQDNFLYRNNGDGGFTLVTNSIVTRDGGTSVGCAWGDYDNDGWLDLFVANLGPVSPNGGSIAPENNFLYHNNGDGTFTKVTSGRLVNDLGYSTGCAWADYDNDGFLDLFVANGWVTRSENNFLYHNIGNTNNWINFRLVGTVSNRSAIGAKVRLNATIGGKSYSQLREISGGSNYGSQNDMRANFGLGDATNVDTVRIEWPSGTVQELHNVATRQFLPITEPPRLLASKTNGAPQFALKGGRGFNYQIDTSTNLADWSLLGTVTITNQSGTAPILDTNAPDARGRFYRAVQP